MYIDKFNALCLAASRFVLALTLHKPYDLGEKTYARPHTKVGTIKWHFSTLRNESLRKRCEVQYSSGCLYSPRCVDRT